MTRVLSFPMAFVFWLTTAFSFYGVAQQSDSAVSIGKPGGNSAALESARAKFEAATKSLSETATVAELYQAVAPIMTKQAQSDFKIWADRWGKEQAPKLKFEDETLTVTQGKKSFTVRLEVRDKEAFWLINKKEIQISKLRSPEELKDQAEKILRAEIGKVDAAGFFPSLILGNSAQAFSMWGALFGALLGFGLPMLFGASTTTSIGGALVGGALGGWFLGSSSRSGRSGWGVN